MEVFGEISVDEVIQLVNRYCYDHIHPVDSYQIISHQVRTLGDSPQGFLGHHFYLEIIIKNRMHPERNEITLKYFIKKAPTSVESFMQYIDGIQVFKKECNLFNQLIPRLQDTNAKFGKFVPESYLVKQNLIIFENLADIGFRMGTSRDQLLDYPHLLCALKTLANMHSASVVLEHKCEKRLIDLHPGCLDENSFPGWEFHNPRNTVLKAVLETLCTLISMVPKYKDSPQLEEILIKFQSKYRQLPEFCRTSTCFRNVLLQGDLWANNLMFEYDDSRSPTDCRIVDFQLSRYGPPVLDLMTLLTAATTSTFRSKHMDSLVENYYYFFEDFLTSYGLDVNNVFSKIEYKKCVNSHRIFGLLMSCHISHETLLPADITTELFSNSHLFQNFISGDRSKYCVKAFETDLMYRERMIDMLTDLIDNHILEEYWKYEY